MDTDTTTRTEADAIRDITLEGARTEVLSPGGLEHIVIPAGATSQILDLERWDAIPRRKKGTVDVHDGTSLGAYIKAHDAGITALFGDVFTLTITGVLNGHAPDPGGPGWGDHRARLDLRPTPEWDAWRAMDRNLVNQVTFAEHIEDHLDDIVDPPAADLLELATTFEAKMGVDFEQGTVLESGQRSLVYKETVAARAGTEGRITIPREFTLGVAPFEGTDRFRVTARLRYRIQSGTLAIGYHLVRPDDVEREAFRTVLGAVEEDTGIVAYRGAAPTA